jgi:hypothetical protein
MSTSSTARIDTQVLEEMILSSMILIHVLARKCCRISEVVRCRWNYLRSHFSVTFLSVNYHHFPYMISERSDVLVSCWHGCRNFVAVEISLLYSQPFTNKQFHFLVNSGFGDPSPRQVSLHRPTCVPACFEGRAKWLTDVSLPVKSGMMFLNSCQDGLNVLGLCR